jgi:hypothetical protein
MRFFAKHLVIIAAAGALACAHAAAAQTRVSIGGGAGIAGSTDASLSEGRGGPVLMGQVVHGVAPFVGIGAEVNYWRGGNASAAFATGQLQLHLPPTAFVVKLGGGYGRGNPDGRGTVTGPAAQVGAAYDITLQRARVMLTVFGNGLAAYSASRSMQMVDGGLAITW